jgi:sec-independent protein translocase protein TatA
MVLSPIELIVIAIVVIVLVMWGPKKIPELARSLGRAKKEFDKGVKETS